MKEAILLVIIPCIVANILHMICVKYDGFSIFKIPVSEPLFGKNKTYRGFLFLIPVTAMLTATNGIIFELVDWKRGLYIGGMLGMAYAIFELPNSYLKRKKGIPSGGVASKNKWMFRLFDKTDSAFGVSLVYSVVSGLAWYQGIFLFLLCSFLHVLFSLLLVSLKIKKQF